MANRKVLLISLATLSVVAIAGTLAGLGLAGAFDSGGGPVVTTRESEPTTTPGPIEAPPPSLTSAPEPTETTTGEPAQTQGAAGVSPTSETSTATPDPTETTVGGPTRTERESVASPISETATAAPRPTDSPLPEPTATESATPPPISDRTEEGSPASATSEEPTAAPRPTESPLPEPTATQSAAPTPVPAEGPTDRSMVEPDPNFREALEHVRFYTTGWRTDFSRHSVPYDVIIQAAPARDAAIPAIDEPRFTTYDDASEWLGDREPVIALEIDGDARAYPLQILIWHEVANDTVGGVPVTVTFCPLCNSAIVFDRRLEGIVYDFGVSGNLINSDLIMYDRETHSWWQQLTGEAVVGSLTGRKLHFLPASIIAWEDFKSAYPDGKVLSKKTGFTRAYGMNPYSGYDDVDSSPFLFFGEADDRLLSMERVVAVTLGGVDLAFPFSVLKEETVVDYQVDGEELVVFFKPGAVSALDRSSIRESRDVGATGVFDPNLDGRKLSFQADGDDIVDEETGSVWNILGIATQGPLAGKRLEQIVHGAHLWFAWAVFKPDTTVYRGGGD